MRVIATDQFEKDLTEKVYTVKLLEQILKLVRDTLPVVPTIGRVSASPTILKVFGDNIHTLSVKPLIIVYEIDTENETLYVLGLIHDRQIQ